MKEDLFEAIIGAVALDSDWDMEELQEVIQIMLDPDSYLNMTQRTIMSNLYRNGL